MWINKYEIKKISDDIRKTIDGQNIDFRDNKEGILSLLKNDIHTLATLKSEQAESFHKERDVMSDMLENMSHQLKTPLTSLMIMADLLEGSPLDKQTEFIYNIKIGIAQMEWLVSNILKMARLDADVVIFSKKNIKVEKIIKYALEPLQILLELKNQQVEVNNGDIEIYCDEKWTIEALTNVLKNASEYSPDGGKIIIDAGINPISQWISITDNGEGISFDKMANLFKRFEGSRSDKGYGIGLPLALKIMYGQNGDISVDGGGNGKGATFKLKFYK